MTIEATALVVTLEDGKQLLIERPKDCVYVKVCPYQGHEFTTDDPRQKFCKRSHRVMFFRKNSQ